MKSSTKFVNKLRHSSRSDSLSPSVGDSPIMTPDTPHLDMEGAPFMRPSNVNVNRMSNIGAPDEQASRQARPKTAPHKLLLPEASKETPSEMLPVLSLLAAHGARVYQEGYFMLLKDLDNDGQPVPSRQWAEVFGQLQGMQLTTWDARQLDSTGDADPQYTNITDATFKSMARLPSPSGDLNNVIVLSTTMKNRYLLQFSSTKLFDEWTAALRLAVFEDMSLQEAYTGALMSSKGTQLNGVRTLLGPTKSKREGWCSVRFGAGMPWRRVWVVACPGSLLTSKERQLANVTNEKVSKKELSQYGRVAFYEAKGKKKPLAVIVRAYTAYAVFPEKAVLINNSTLIKVEGHVVFPEEEKVAKLSTVHLLPEPRPGILGVEVLIRFLIPMFDVFQLYGRPQRLNADKSDLRSMLFAMPTLPHAYYCDVVDIAMLATQPSSEKWDNQQWIDRIRDLLARKVAAGFKGLGNIHEIARDRSHSLSSSRARVVSQPPPQYPPAWQRTAASSSDEALSDVVAPRESPTQSPPRKPVARLSPARPVPPKPDSELQVRKRAVGGPRPEPGHERSVSEGMNPNTLIIAPGTTPLTPNLGGNNASTEDFYGASRENLQVPAARDPTRASRDSFESALDNFYDREPTSTTSVNVFDPAYRPPVPRKEISPEASPSAEPSFDSIDTKHMSYAEYSEYVRTYVQKSKRSSLEPAREAGEEMDFRAARAPPPPDLLINGSSVSQGGANVPHTPIDINSPMESPAAVSTEGSFTPTEVQKEFQSPYTNTRSYQPDRTAPEITQSQRRPSGPRPEPRSVPRSEPVQDFRAELETRQDSGFERPLASSGASSYEDLAPEKLRDGPLRQPESPSYQRYETSQMQYTPPKAQPLSSTHLQAGLPQQSVPQPHYVQVAMAQQQQEQQSRQQGPQFGYGYHQNQGPQQSYQPPQSYQPTQGYPQNYAEQAAHQAAARRPVPGGPVQNQGNISPIHMNRPPPNVGGSPSGVRRRPPPGMGGPPSMVGAPGPGGQRPMQAMPQGRPAQAYPRGYGGPPAPSQTAPSTGRRGLAASGPYGPATALAGKPPHSG